MLFVVVEHMVIIAKLAFFPINALLFYPMNFGLLEHIYKQAVNCDTTEERSSSTST